MMAVQGANGIYPSLGHIEQPALATLGRGAKRIYPSLGHLEPPGLH